jgi:RNA polymerase sigma-70 factor (ECF subfamily)
MGEMSELAVKQATEKTIAFPELMSTKEAVQRYKDMVYAIALTHTKHRQDADDVFQDVFLVYHRKQPVFPSEERRKAWLITTTLNCSLQLTGSSWSRKVIAIQGSEDLEKPTAVYQFESEEQDDIFRAMQELPSNYRVVLHLFYFEDLPIARIAEVLGIAPGTVRVQLSRGRAQMRSLLKGAYFDEE